MTTQLEPRYVAWMKSTLSLLKNGGTWGAPYNGMIIQKVSGKSVRILREGDQDMELTREYIRAAGYTIEGEPKP